MINILIVSHSKDLAKGVYDLAKEMAKDVNFDYVGGTEDETLGSNFELINEKIISLSEDNNLIIFFDLGSSMMNSQMIIEMLDDKTKEKIILADLPIVEGVIDIAMQIQIGESFENIKKYIEKNKYGKLM